VIQEKTGYIMNLPKDGGISRDSLQKILFVANAVKTGKLTLQKLNATVTLHRVVALSLLHRYFKEGKLSKLSLPYEMFTETVLDKQIPLGPAKLSSPSGKPLGDIKKIYNNLKRGKGEHIQIEFELQKPEFEFDWFTKSRKQIQKIVKKEKK